MPVFIFVLSIFQSVFQQVVPRLAVLCSRLLRTALRRSISARHGGVPSLGYLEEPTNKPTFKRKRMEQIFIPHTVPPGQPHQQPHSSENGSNLSPQSTTTNDTTDEDDHGSAVNSSVDDASDSSDTSPQVSGTDRAQSSTDGSEESDDGDNQGGMARLFHHFIRRARLQGAASTSVTIEPSDTAFPNPSSAQQIFLNVSDDQNDSGIQLHFVTGQHEAAAADNDDDDNLSNSTNSNEPSNQRIRISGGGNIPPEILFENRSVRRRNIRERSRSIYHPPSYTYREEMTKIMSEELMLPKYFINIVMNL